MDIADYWDPLACKYDDLYSTPWSRFEDDQLAGVLRSIIARGPVHRVLDVGCGTGLGLELISRFTHVDYTGVDISSAMLTELIAKHPAATAILGRGAQINGLVEEEGFDLVIAINVSASFFGSPQVFLQSVFRSLRPGGHALLSFLNRWSLRRLMKAKVGRRERYFTRGDRRHVRAVPSICLSKRGLTQALVSKGFCEVQVETRSVLGGVYERWGAIALERVLGRIAPLGHEVYCIVRKC